MEIRKPNNFKSSDKSSMNLEFLKRKKAYFSKIWAA